MTTDSVIGRSAGAPVLVVDDTRPKRLAIAAILAPLGHRVVEVVSGEAALHAVMEEPFAVILMDVQMPGMDGYETARLIRLRSESERTPIIFITAHALDEAQIPIAYCSGAVDFIFAPLVPGVLRAKVSIFAELFLKSRQLEQSLMDVTLLGQRFRDSEVSSRSVLANVADGIVTVSSEGLIESFNHAATALFGYTEAEAIGRPFATMLAPHFGDDDASHSHARLDVLAHQHRNGRPPEATGSRKDGSNFPMELHLTNVQLGARRVHIGCMRDISERQAHTDTLQHRALHDGLTDLANRVLFADRVDHAIRAAVRSKAPLALMVMDLDGFKQVNDTLGHQCGDELLRLVAERLVACLRAGDTVARLGGDEFGILPAGETDLPGAATMAWKIQQAIEPTFVVEGHAISVKASIGITMFPEHGDNIDDLLRRADLAMYEAKRSGCGHTMFSVTQEEAPVRRLALLGSLRQCIERDELVLHYQPQIDLSTRRIIGVEALIRWNHPSGRLFMPGDFMPEVERNELMIPITEWVIAEALETLRLWRDDGYDLTMAVNLGARCLDNSHEVLDTVARLRTLWGIPPELLTFELTERSLIDTTLPELLASLERMEERLSIDDFGTGYSSLKYLQQLPVHEIKADRSFVTNMAEAADDAIIVQSTIDLAHNLSMKVVAEGVENRATMDVLLAYGCDVAQGFYFSRPIPRDELTRWLRTSEFGLTWRLNGETDELRSPTTA